MNKKQFTLKEMGGAAGVQIGTLEQLVRAGRLPHTRAADGTVLLDFAETMTALKGRAAGSIGASPGQCVPVQGTVRTTPQ